MAKIFVIRAEDVYKYIERAKTEKENDYDLMEKFAEFQPKTIFLAHLLFLGLFVILLLILACAQMRRPLLQKNPLGLYV